MNKILKTNLYNSFYNDYLKSHSKTNNFLSNIHNISWKDTVHLLDPGTKHYQNIKRILAKQNADLTSEKAKYYIQQLSEPESVIIITGQQLGIFGSPLYTIYKIITTIKLAELLNKQKIGNYFIPVFWLESEDHDFQEISRVGMLDRHFSPEQVKYEGRDRGKVSIRHYQFESVIQSFVQKIRETLLETEFTTTLFANIENIYRPGMQWITATREFLKFIFQSSGLLFFQPGDEEIKQISVDFFERLLTENENVSSAFRQNSENLVKAGYHNQVTDIPGKTFIHIEDAKKQRSHLYREGNNFSLKESGSSYTIDKTRQLISKHPVAVSTSVVSRPLLQSWLLPVAAYVAGPAEIAYWAQLSKIFTYFELCMPILYPRISATLLETKIARYVTKHSPDIENIPVKRNSFIENYYKNLKDTGEEDPVKNLKNTIENEGLKIQKYLTQLDPTLVDTSNKTIERMKQNLANLENRVIKAREQKENQLTGNLNQIHTAFFPEEIPQERYLSIIYFLNKFGPYFVDDLFNHLEINNFEHQIIFI